MNDKKSDKNNEGALIIIGNYQGVTKKAMRVLAFRSHKAITFRPNDFSNYIWLRKSELRKWLQNS